MAYWPKVVRDRPFVSLLAVAAALFVVVLATTLLGPVAGIAAAVLAVTGAVIYARHLRVLDGRAWAAADTFSFADVVVRMRAKDAAQALIETQRRQDLIAAR